MPSMINIFLAILLWGMRSSQAITLDVVVQNIEIGKGNIVVDIYNDDKSFFKKPFISKTLRANNQNLNFSFDIPEGIYAVAVYQDINENGKLDKGLFSIPKEPYGLSNNYRPKFSAPTFDDCKFKAAQQTTITITLK